MAVDKKASIQFQEPYQRIYNSIFFSYFAIISWTLGHTQADSHLNNAKLSKPQNFSKFQIGEKLILCKNYLWNNTSTFSHTSWRSHEAEASMNFELWKAYLIKKSSGHKVTQWVLESHFSVIWRRQFPKCQWQSPWHLLMSLNYVTPLILQTCYIPGWN